MRSEEEHHDIVIVGGGICGLATALALHRIQEAWHHKSTVQVKSSRVEDFRCLKRTDLIQVLFDNLPAGSVRLGCQIVAVEGDSSTSFPILYVHDGSIIKAKVLIGCDGSNSIISKSLGLGALNSLPNCVIRGLTNYPNGHDLERCFLRNLDNGYMAFGRIPIDDKLVHWFVDWPYPDRDTDASKDPKFIMELAMQQIKDYPAEMIEMVESSNPSSLNLTRIRYRSPWHLVFGNFRRGTMTVAGDAMHMMGPFLGQGGCVALEDAVVLARNLAEAMPMGLEGGRVGDGELKKRIEAAFENYVKERKPRVLRLAMQSMLVGMLISSPSKIKRLLSLALLVVFFGGASLSYTRYDCGPL
ncbi:monooxygenase 1-like isoform X2 [Phoenix dactylifera]|uniref:Monooxygenase 1-like isoform X2 n=1 Tax=Phoenix dactylifera TaxID=42345 RepID=A0A8B9ASV9_PHODC|nr:monooxygenase 1-like isoform X2 [Phoenix dactylifera]